MKKVLSLILALAMVLSCVPFVFAEGEEETVVIPDSFDLAEAFAVDYEFTGDPAVDYPSGTMPAAITAEGYTGPWQIGNYSNGSGYDTFSAYSKLHRGHRFARANEDTTHPGFTVAEGKTYSTEPVVAMVWSTNAAVTQVSADQMYWHYEGGAPSTYGDGGYAIPDAGGYTGSLGYEFGEGRILKTSSLGYQNAGSVHPAAVFTAPKTGLINPQLKVAASAADAVVFQVYKIDAVTGEKTAIYPAAGTGTTSIVTPNDAVTVPEKWTSGWQLLGTALTDYNDAQLWVNEGDQIVMRYAAIGPAGANKYFSIDAYKLDYLTSVETDCKAEYAEDRIIDLTDEIVLPLDTATITVDTAVLSETDTAGVYTLSENYVDGTETTITVENGATTQTITASFKEIVMVYDFGELFATTTVYTGTAADYPQEGMPAAMPNNGSQIWSAGYYTYASSFATMTYYTKLYRYTANSRAYDDNTNARNPYMTYTISGNNDGAVTEDAATGYYTSDPNGNYGSLGYSFGGCTTANRYAGTSALGHSSADYKYNIKAAVFNAPRAGVINPSFVAAAHSASKVAYRMDKVAADGTRTRIYPLPTNSDTFEIDLSWSTSLNDETLPEKFREGWAFLPGSVNTYNYLTENNGYARVEKGDRIELLFAPYDAGNTSFSIDSLKMTYTEQFGPDDELFTTSPMAAYEESYTYTYPTEKVADVQTILANTIAQGTIEYTVSGNSDILKATATPGVYELTGTFNVGGEAAVVTAGYYAPGKSSANGDEPRFTQSTNVYVQPLSNTVDTFNGKYDIFDLSEMSYEMDEAFIIPYYSNAAEREIYGIVDLGITAEWANATATISNPSKFEYLGNGRIRALSTHTWTEAGGTQGATDGTTAPSKTGAANLTSKRDEMSMGEPVVLTMVATDGGVRKFGLWSFPTTVQNLDAEGADPNAYTLFPSANTISNSVVSVEGYTLDGTFIPTYKDPACGDGFSILVEHKYSIQNFAPRMGSDGSIYLSMNGASNWEGQKSNRDWHNARGISQTFTAPKDGTINLTGYWPQDGMSVYNGYVAAQNADGNYFNYAVKLYDVDGTLIATLWDGDYGVESSSSTTHKLVASEVNTNYATQADDEAKTLTFDVKKGQKVRVMLDFTYDQNWNAYLTFSRSNGYAPAPVWTYDLGDLPDEFTEYSVDVTPTVDGLTVQNVLTLFYDEKGNLVSVSPEALEGSSEDGYFSVSLPDDVDVSYAKIFFWDSLNNIKPLASDIVVRK